MTFSSPLVLLLVLPLLGMLVWLCTGRLTRREVPFVYLWQDASGLAAPVTAWQRPPAWPIVLLIAAILAVVAAAGPSRNVDLAPPGPALTLQNFTLHNRQAMVRLLGGALPVQAGVSLSSGDVSEHVSIDLPAGRRGIIFSTCRPMPLRSAFTLMQPAPPLCRPTPLASTCSRR